MNKCECLGNGISSILILGGRYTPRQWSCFDFFYDDHQAPSIYFTVNPNTVSNGPPKLPIVYNILVRVATFDSWSFVKISLKCNDYNPSAFNQLPDNQNALVQCLPVILD